METANLLESAGAPEAPRTMRKRGICVVALGCMGAACWAGLHQETSEKSWVRRYRDTRRSILKAFADRSLTEEEFTGSVHFAFKEKGAELDGMTIGATVEKDTEWKKDAFPWGTIGFKSQEGKAEDLVHEFKKLKSFVVGVLQLPKGAITEETDPVSFSADNNSVTISIHGNEMLAALMGGGPPPEEYMHEDGPPPEEYMHADGPPPGAMAMPEMPEIGPNDLKYKFHLKFGKTFQEMFKDPSIKIPAIPGGFETSMSLTIAKALFMGIPMAYTVLEPFSGAEAGASLYYTSADAFDEIPGVPTLKEALGAAVQGLHMLPPPVAESVKALSKYADGITDASFHDAGIMIKYFFENFHLTPVLSALLEAEA